MAPSVAFACEDPDSVTIALRDAPPESVQDGEIVLELDSASMTIIKREPTEVESQGHRISFSNDFASYRIVRVLAGSFAEPTARVPFSHSSCRFLGGRTSGLSYLVARPATEDDGFAYLLPRPITGADLRAKWESEEAN